MDERVVQFRGLAASKASGAARNDGIGLPERVLAPCQVAVPTWP